MSELNIIRQSMPDRSKNLTAVPKDLLKGKTALVNGTILTGTLIPPPNTISMTGKCVVSVWGYAGSGGVSLNSVSLPTFPVKLAQLTITCSSGWGGSGIINPGGSIDFKGSTGNGSSTLKITLNTNGTTLTATLSGYNSSTTTYSISLDFELNGFYA